DINMENSDESVDVESRDLHSTNGGDTYDSELNADENESYSASSGDKSSEIGDDASDNGNNDGDAIDSEGFAVRKASSRIREINGIKITQMKQFVCNIHGLREKKHLTRFVHLHSVYRKISEADKARIDGLQTRGIRTCHIMGDGRMKSLFWTDGSSRSNYFCFGDVLTFDTTYQKNKYNYPLVVFSWCNHHSQTVIFGAALVSDETTETYKWMLNCFLECREGKQPKAVVTYGDGAMMEAIK
ncbi:hypothetical protein L195_g029143, partial [Trifolium pratense]